MRSRKRLYRPTCPIIIHQLIIHIQYIEITAGQFFGEISCQNVLRNYWESPLSGCDPALSPTPWTLCNLCFRFQDCNDCKIANAHMQMVTIMQNLVLYGDTRRIRWILVIDICLVYVWKWLWRLCSGLVWPRILNVLSIRFYPVIRGGTYLTKIKFLKFCRQFHMVIYVSKQNQKMILADLEI